MDTQVGPGRRVEWRLPEQHFSGTAEEVASQLDELIVSLVTCRRWLAMGVTSRPPTAAAPATPWGAW